MIERSYLIFENHVIPFISNYPCTRESN